MTSEERDLAIGQAMRKRQQAKARLDCLRNKAAEYEKALSDAAKAHTTAAEDGLIDLKLLITLSGQPTYDQQRELLLEIMEMNRLLVQSEDRLKELGIVI